MKVVRVHTAFETVYFISIDETPYGNTDVLKSYNHDVDAVVRLPGVTTDSLTALFGGFRAWTAVYVFRVITEIDLNNDASVDCDYLRLISDNITQMYGDIDILCSLHATEGAVSRAD